MGFYRGPTIVRDGLVLALDAGSERSYPGSGDNITDLAQGVVGTKGAGVLFTTVDGIKTFQFTTLTSTNLITFSKGTNDYEYSSQSVCIWFKTTTTKSNMDFVTGTNSADITDRWRHQTTNTQGGAKGIELDWIATGSWGAFSYSTINYDDGEWHYFCTGYDDSTNETKLWFDGIEYTASYSNFTDWVTGQNINRINVGGDASELGSNFIGYIPVVKIYNRVLTQSEITQNFNAQKGRFGL